MVARMEDVAHYSHSLRSATEVEDFTPPVRREVVAEFPVLDGVEIDATIDSLRSRLRHPRLTHPAHDATLDEDAANRRPIRLFRLVILRAGPDVQRSLIGIVDPATANGHVVGRHAKAPSRAVTDSQAAHEHARRLNLNLSCEAALNRFPVPAAVNLGRMPVGRFQNNLRHADVHSFAVHAVQHPDRVAQLGCLQRSPDCFVIALSTLIHDKDRHSKSPSGLKEPNSSTSSSSRSRSFI